MTRDRELQLKNKLKNIIREFGYDNNIKQSVMDEFKSRNLPALRAAWVFSENLDLDTLTDSEEDIQFLFLFSLALNNALKEKDIDMLKDYQNYFTKVEVSEWENYAEEKESDNVFPYNFKDAQEIVPGRQWQTKLTAQQLNELYNVLIWNPNSQRGFKVTKKAIRINEDPNKVKEIANSMLAGTYYPDHLKINVLKGETAPIWNPKTRILTLREGTILNIFDGQHRKSATALALIEEPDLEFVWPIVITHLSEIETHNAMVQINKQTPIREEVIAPKDYSKNENLVVDKIMDSRGDLANATKDTDSFVKSDRGLTTKSILADAIKDNYGDQLDSAMQRDEVASWIVEFTNYLMGYYQNEFIVNPYEVKKNSYINNLNMFYAYIALSTVLKDNKQWKEELKQAIESIDFSIENPIWREIGIIKENKINKTTKNKLYNLFKGGVK
ncbi:MAG: DNA sulfur modification protein DndB [Clostridium sp.]|uniref:DNA sulfur modification protein DndB n=1 Tax=Clostridium sp. TaxID=1506 RepID=UPI0025BDC585|nr:DNA sulfur modification protein DndB [Clostridium sp.]MCE5220170.1 DNA sulfur modification protein DndB [Clostridium sp.]